MELMEKFERNIKLMLKEKEFNQAELAHRLNVGKSTISNWLCSHREPSISYVYKLTKELDCTFEELVD